MLQVKSVSACHELGVNNSHKVENGYSYAVSTVEGTVYCKYFVDARGLSSLIRRHRTGILPSARSEVFAPWINPDTVDCILMPISIQVFSLG